jgi:type IV pilus assembly protein PilM
MKPKTFYHSKPNFGLDIGTDSIKVVQTKPHHGGHIISCYGLLPNNPGNIKNGEIVDVKSVATIIDSLLSSHLVGTLNAERAALSVPIARVYTRVLSLPNLGSKELKNAVDLEVEQSIPMSATDLYIDYEVIHNDDEHTEVQLVAVPKKIIDSYLEVCRLLKLEVVLVETNIQAESRLIKVTDSIISQKAFFIVDVGGTSIDMGVFDNTLRVTGTIDEGGETLTNAIADALHIAKSQAHLLKTIYGLNLSTKQDKIQKAVSPILQKVALEIKRMDRFYQERVKKQPIEEIILTGGGSNMPGIGDYLTNELRVPTRVCAPWSKGVTFGKLPKPPQYELPRFLTATGLSLVSEKELK